MSNRNVNHEYRNMKILVTGGAGFIGSAVIRYILSETDYQVVNLDSLTYAGNLDSIPATLLSSQYAFECVDICNKEQVDRVFCSINLILSCILLLNRMLTAQSKVRTVLSKPILLARITYLNRHGFIGCH